MLIRGHHTFILKNFFPHPKIKKHFLLLKSANMIADLLAKLKHEYNNSRIWFSWQKKRHKMRHNTPIGCKTHNILICLIL